MNNSGWHAEWRRISGFIRGIVEAGQFFVAARAAQAQGHHGSATVLLLDQISAAIRLLRQFFESRDAQMPAAGRTVLGSHLSAALPRTDEGAGFTGVVEGITFLAAFRAEFEYAIADTEAVTRSLVVRAFLHLQRSIIADEVIRGRWKDAYASGEPRCERLGGAHLLLHGIWAFKASAAGEQTDLVLGEPVNLVDAERAAVALVLTEWKIVRDPRDTEAKIAEARSQARLYSGSALAGFELASSRYLVLVSGGRLTLPAGSREDGVSYEHVGVAVDPEDPSIESRKAGRS